MVGEPVMPRSQTGDDATDQLFTRRKVLLSSGVLGVAALAGCGDPGAGVNTTVSPAGNGVETESPMATAEPTETEMATDTATETGTDSDTDTATETETTTETGEVARVRIAHLSPNAPAVDVYVDGSVVLEDVSFGAVSDYLEVAGGSHSVEITAAGDPDTSVFEGEVSVEAGTDYTVAAIGELGEEADQPFEPLVLVDENERPSGDMARIRAVHASPDAPAVDITAGENVLFDGVSFGDSGYVEVPGGDYTIEIRSDTPDNDGEVADSFDVTLAGGQVYTAFVAGYLTPDDEPADTPFNLILAADSGA